MSEYFWFDLEVEVGDVGGLLVLDGYAMQVGPLDLPLIRLQQLYGTLGEVKCVGTTAYVDCHLTKQKKTLKSVK